MQNLSNKISSKLDKIQRRGLRAVMGYRQSTPINVILCESKELPLAIRNRYLCKNFLTRAATSTQMPILRSLESIKEIVDTPTTIDRVSGFPIVSSFIELEERFRLVACTESPLCYSELYEALTYRGEVNLYEGSNIKHKGIKAEIEFCNIFGGELEHYFCLFTDGSKFEDIAFAGFGIISRDKSVEFMGRTAGFVSSFCVESMAILQALELGWEQEWSRIAIFSDSRSVLSAVESPYDHRHSSFLILRIKSLMFKLESTKNVSVKLIWIPSNRGIVGNEHADELAKKAIREGKDTQMGIPPLEFRNLWRDQMYRELYDWTIEESERRGALYCNNFVNESRHTWFRNFNINRRTVSSINRLRSGHTSLRASLFRFDIVDSPLCLRCNIEETPDHVFWECEDFDGSRKDLQKALIEVRGFLPHCVNYLLATLDFDIIYAMDTFICSINKYI